jgi:membrane protein implicated in regulation of membrane protease activity
MISMFLAMALPLLGIGFFYLLPFWSAAPIYICLLLFSALVYYGMVSGMKGKVQTGKKGMLGKDALVLEDIDPEGKVEYEGEIWTATAHDQKFIKGKRVRISGFQGLTLMVEDPGGNWKRIRS